MKIQRNVNQEESKIPFSVPQQAMGTMKITKFFTQLPRNCFLLPPSSTHIQKTNTVTPRGSSYATP